MSDIRASKSIPVYNYNAFHVSIVTNVKTHALEPCRDGSPTMDYLTFDEIDYVNSQSNAIKNGLIRFNKTQEKELYEALNIENWDKILTNENIKETLLTPSKEGLQTILDIRDDMTFERVRCILTNLINSGEYDVSNRVINLVQLRHSEFKKGLVKSQLILKEEGTSNKEVSSDVEALKEQNKTLQEQLLNMQKMMEQMMAMQNASLKVGQETKVEEEPKKVGRPPTKK